MIVNHKGHTINVVREECLGGWPMLYTTVIRESDGYICLDHSSETDEYVRDAIKRMRALIDTELQEADPWEQRADCEYAETRGIVVI